MKFWQINSTMIHKSHQLKILEKSMGQANGSNKF